MALGNRDERGLPIPHAGQDLSPADGKRALRPRRPRVRRDGTLPVGAVDGALSGLDGASSVVARKPEPGEFPHQVLACPFVLTPARPTVSRRPQGEGCCFLSSPSSPARYLPSSHPTLSGDPRGEGCFSSPTLEPGAATPGGRFLFAPVARARLSTLCASDAERRPRVKGCCSSSTPAVARAYPPSSRPTLSGDPREVGASPRCRSSNRAHVCLVGGGAVSSRTSLVAARFRPSSRPQ
jgi:hypothetical protein